MKKYQSRYTKEELLFLLLDLLTYTTPFCSENLIHKFLPTNGRFDEVGNYIVNIGKSDTLFCCHMDTVGITAQYINPLYEDGFIYSKITKSCLGGDDKCGVLCCLALINAGVPGTYIFHIGEEKGAIGAEHILSTLDLSQFKRAIEFDRRGTNSVITHMMMNTVCSDSFSKELCNRLGLGFIQDETGIFTDVYKYRHIIPEVVNISCGYFNEHSSKETINADWLIEEMIPSIISLDWESLPIERDPLKEEDELKSILSHYRNDFNRKYFSSEYKYEDFKFERKDYKTIPCEGWNWKDEKYIWDDEEEENFIKAGAFTKAKVCSFCEKEDEGDLTYFEVENKDHYLCTDCHDFLCTEAVFRKKSKKKLLKSLLPEYEQYNSRL